DFALRQKEIATRFMRAYIRAVRFYNDALKEGRLQGTTADEVIAILSEATPIKNRDVYKSITPTGMNPDGRVNQASLAYDLAFYSTTLAEFCFVADDFGFPNQFFSDSWVVGFWRADHDCGDTRLEE